jgi:hypothetical protein
MSEGKHTPGPWEVSCTNTYIVRAAKFPNQAIANCYTLSLADGEGEANRRLIAKSPELLRGLKETLSRFVSAAGENSDFEDDRQFIKAMRELITQAEGK